MECEICGKQFDGESSLLGHIPKVHPKEAKKLLRGESNPFYGRHHTKGTKAILSKKCSIALKGRASPRKGKTYEEIYGKTKAEEIKRKVSISGRKKPDLSGSPHLAYILGAISGDGCIASNRKGICLNVVDDPFVEEFERHANSIGVHVWKKKYPPKGEEKQWRWYVIALSRSLVEWYENLNYEKIKRVALLYPANFLEGFFDAEGHAYLGSTNKNGKYKQRRAFMVNTNLRLLEIAKECVEKLGIKANIHKHTHRSWRLTTLRGEEGAKKLIKEIKPNTHVVM